MPLLRKQQFLKQKPPKDLKPDDEVFWCEVTGEIFTSYDEFFERVIMCNSLVWTCEVTGKSGLTYLEAKEHEDRARKTIAFPPSLQKPLLFLATLTHRTRLVDMIEDVYIFARDKFFINEPVDFTQNNEKKRGTVIKVLVDSDTAPKKKAPANPALVAVNGDASDNDSDCVCLDDPTPSTSNTAPDISEATVNKDGGAAIYQYVVQEQKGSHIFILSSSAVSRKKASVTRDRCKLYLKQHCDAYGDGIWKVKEKYYKRWKLDEMNFNTIFGGPPPNFPKSVVKRIKKGPLTTSQKGSAKKQKKAEIVTIDDEDDLIAQAKNEMKARKKIERADSKKKKLEMEREIKRMREEHERLMKMTVEQRAAEKEKLRVEKEKKWEEEKERRKEERCKEREKKKQEKKEKEEHMKEWKKSRDDMECDDLKPLPVPTAVQSRVLAEVFGEVVMVLEYLTGFSSIMNVDDEGPPLTSFEDLVRSVQETDVNGTYADLLRIFLTSIFSLQEEEEEEQELEHGSLAENKLYGDRDSKGVSYKDLLSQASMAAQWPQLYYGTSLRKLPLENFTITEVLRLHFLSSGAPSSVSNAQFQYQQRGGYTSLDDAGLELRRAHPHIISVLAEKNVFDLAPRDKLRILTALMQQCLTYVAARDLIEDNQDKLRVLRNELRQLQWAEERRRKDESAFWWRKRCEERAKEREQEAQRKEQKKREKEDKLKADELGKDGAQKTESTLDNTSTKSHDDKVPVAERKSHRLLDAKMKEEEVYDLTGSENIDWEKLTPDERERMRIRFDRKELELNKKIVEALRGSAMYPIGRDRTFRRFWVFPSVPGLFIEDEEDDIDEESLCPIEQNTDVSMEDKSTSSDKENDSFGHPNVVGASAMNPGQDEVKSMEMVSVHDQITARNKVRWSFYNTPEQVEKLINSLNARGFREGPLKSYLQEQKTLLLETIEKCPESFLCLADDDDDGGKVSHSAVQYQSLKSRNKTTQGAVKNASAEQFLELNLRDTLLDLEERIYFGSLGSLKVKSRVVWREAIEGGGYDPQSDDLTFSSKLVNGHVASVEDVEERTRRLALRDLIRALLQIQHMLDLKYLTAPLGEDEKSKKTKVKVNQPKPKERKPKPKKTDDDLDDSDDDTDNESDEDMKPNPQTALERWESSLCGATSLAQVFLHLAVLDSSVAWTKSALHARCKICRRKGDGEKMLLCDGCDRGHHMYCLKPPVKKVPQGDWFCPVCRPKEVVRSPRKRRRSTFLEEEEEVSINLVSSEESLDSDLDDSDEVSESSAEEDEDSQEDSVDEEEPTPYKIKFLSKLKKQQTSSGRSTPTSVASKTSTSKSSTGKTTKMRSVEKSVHSTERPGTKGSEKLTGRASSRRSQEPTSLSSSRAMRGSLDPSEKRATNQHSTEKTTNRSSRHSSEKQSSRSRRSHPESERPVSRNSLDTAIKRKLDLDDDSPNSKKALLSKSRGGEKMCVMKECEELVTELSQREEAWPFLAPVTRRDAPDYFDLIKHPMDFSTMRNKINHFEYSVPADLLHDVRLIFSNCEQYNMPTAPEFQASKKLSRFFEKRARELKLEQKARAVKSPVKSRRSAGK